VALKVGKSVGTQPFNHGNNNTSVPELLDWPQLF
jgi:hypothetical protein